MRKVNMKYLKKYNETVYIQNSPIKDEISDILLELKEDFGFYYLIHNYLESDLAGEEFVKVVIRKGNRFDYKDIEEYIERIKSFMKMNGYNIWDYTCYLSGQIPPTPEIEIDNSRHFNRLGERGWSDTCYSFKITFIKGDNSGSPYRWLCGTKYEISTSVKEELKSDVYKSAADKLIKIGHTKRPEELMKWYNIVKQRETDAKKKKVIEEAKKLGVYQCTLEFRHRERTVSAGGGTVASSSQMVSKDFTGDFYLRLSFEDYNLQENYPIWKEEGGSLWLPFSFGVIPVDEKGVQYCEEVIKPQIGMGSDETTFWLGEFWVCMTEKNEEGDMKLNPPGKAYFECHEGQFHLSNRASAILLKKKLFDIFSGEIVLNETSELPGGDKELIIEFLCVDREHEIDEYEDIMNSIKRINLNTLYKD